MEKIISLFKRDYEGSHQIYNEVVPGAEWVLLGEGSPTVKWDGTACLVREGRLYKRYDAKNGKAPPEGFEPAQEQPDAITGHWPGWLPVGDGPEDRWHREAFSYEPDLADGTYELMGPKVQGNPYKLERYVLRLHGDAILNNVPTDFVGLRKFLVENYRLEGIVWHHPDGRMVKIKRRDFGLPWPLKP